MPELDFFTRPFIFDGAFGTYYAGTGFCGMCERANIDNPSAVTAIHREYIAAGADAIKTNTFSLNINTVPDENELRKLISAGFVLASDAANGSAEVFADIGPMSDGTAQDYLRTAEMFISCGARRFLFETQPEAEPLFEAVEKIKKEIPDAFVIISFAVTPDGFSRSGKHCSELLAQAAAHSGVDAVGLNCLCGPSHMASLVKELLPNVKKPLCAMPNSGYPSMVNGRMIYNDNASYFARKTAEIYACGAAAVGGCCGTTPEYIRALRAEIAALGLSVRENTRIPEAKTAEAGKPLTAVNVNILREKLRSGKRVIAVELDPPLTADYTKTLAAARLVKEHGCDIITVTDSPLSRARADSLITAAMITRETLLPVMPHLSCRDRNTVALKAGLLAANAMGVNTLLAVTGDPLTGSCCDDGTNDRGVFSLNSFKLIAYACGMNAGEFAANPYLVGGALNINAANLSAELERAQRKIKAGALFLITQPVCSAAAIQALKTAHKTLGIPILAGLMPVAGYKNALFLKNEVSGIEIPDELLDSLKNASREQARDISVKYTASIAEAAAGFCDGFCLMTPLGRADIIASLMDEIKKIKD